MMKNFLFSLGGFALRAAFVFWLMLLISLFIRLGELSTSHILIIISISIFLHITKIDIKFLTKAIQWRRFTLCIYSAYALLWIYVFVDYYSIPIYDRGISLMFSRIIVAPISDVLISLLIFLFDYCIYPIKSNSKEFFYITSFLEIVFSFIVIELILRFLRRKLIKT